MTGEKGRENRRDAGWRRSGGSGRGTVWVTLLGIGLSLGTWTGQPIQAQESSLVYPRPLPGPVIPPRFYRDAVARGTRSPDGSPGRSYFQPRISYDIRTRLEPESGLVTGSETVIYRNSTSLRISGLELHLHQNLHAPGVPRNEFAPVTGGVKLGEITAQGQVLEEGPMGRGPAFLVQGQLLHLWLPEPVNPGGEIELTLEWSFEVPQSSSGRMGWSEREMYFIAYWFPKLAVLDDLRGFDAEPYLGGAEFYDTFADYSVAITVPPGWTVMATGALENPEEVLSAQTRERLAAAAVADTVVAVVTAADRRAGRVTASGSRGGLTYRFRAESVRDFTWTTSDEQLWNSTSAVVADRDGDGAEDRVAIHSFYRPDRAPLWADQTPYGKHAIEHHSRYTGFPYPWPHMTSVEGADIIGGGMEFPMLTLIGSYQGRDAEALYNVTSHELAHMWVPMIVGTNEKRHAWMDEGFTTFLEDQGRPEFWPGTDAHAEERDNYLEVAREEAEEPLMRHGDYYYAGGYGTASYPKPATLLLTLRNLLGEGPFEDAYRSYIREWAFKHPAPWDFFNTVERVVGRDLDWFWQAWFFETWTLDHAVASVEEGADGRIIVAVEDRGFAPMPARVVIETSGLGTLKREIPVEHWLRGETLGRIVLPVDAGEVTRVEIDPDFGFPDVDRSNNVWGPGDRPISSAGPLPAPRTPPA